MVESQSRYSIVERLTTKKLNLMSEKHRLADNIKTAEQHVKSLEESKEERTKEITDQAQRDIRCIEREITLARQKADNLKERQKSKEELFDSEIKALEGALNKIEAISKSQEDSSMS